MNFVNVQLFQQTSAPSIVHVDEFHEELSMAERRKREAEERLRQNTAPNKQRFFMELNKKVRASSGHIVPVCVIFNTLDLKASLSRDRRHWFYLC